MFSQKSPIVVHTENHGHILLLIGSKYLLVSYIISLGSLSLDLKKKSYFPNAMTLRLRWLNGSCGFGLVSLCAKNVRKRQPSEMIE